MTVTLHPRMKLLRTMLEEQHQAHINQLAELITHSRSSPDGYDPDTLNALIASARQGIADTAHALRRMADGTYGTCERCHATIPLGRLRILPHARFCVPCHEKQR
jgi:RNA polymerase-binding transcription factor